MSDALGIIPARAGSLGLPGKNVMPLLGKPIVAWVIDAAKASKTLSELVVSTNDPEVEAIARSLDVRVVRRPDDLATATIAIDPALRHAVHAVEAETGRECNPVVWLQANVPTTTANCIDLAVRKYHETGADSVQTLVPYRVPPQWAWSLEGDLMTPYPGLYEYTTRRQETRRAFHLDGSVNVLTRAILMATEGQSHQAYFGATRRAIVLEPGDSVEVDEPFDFDFAEFILSRRTKLAEQR